MMLPHTYGYSGIRISTRSIDRRCGVSAVRRLLRHARHYSNGAQHWVPRAVCLFEKGAAMPLRRHFEATRDDYDVEDDESYPNSDEKTNTGVSGRTWRKRLVEVSASRSFALSVVVVASFIECDVSEYVSLCPSRSRRSASFGWPACRTTRWCCE